MTCWRPDEIDAAGHEKIVITFKIVGLKEKEHPATSLVADEAALLLRGGLCEQERWTARSWWLHSNPAFVAALGIFKKCEAQSEGVKRDSFVVISNNQSDKREVHGIQETLAGGPTEDAEHVEHRIAQRKTAHARMRMRSISASSWLDSGKGPTSKISSLR